MSGGRKDINEGYSPLERKDNGYQPFEDNDKGSGSPDGGYQPLEDTGSNPTQGDNPPGDE
ncbi:hypothetical protein [Kangiella marina]|uniref:Uncharacterized protein n=1 Tax=Kangiella marina TaxID=1079178 RepID=A0ABP8IK39_9GAMM